MGRPAIASDVTRWNRCKDECGCTDPNVPNPAECACWTTSRGKCGRDRRSNAQMRAYAVAVTEVLTGQAMDAYGMLTCPLTGQRFHVSDGHVDKVTPHDGYVRGNVALVSATGNLERAKLQQWAHDIAERDLYVNEVAIASATIPLLPVSVAFAQRERCAGKQMADVNVNTCPNQSNVIHGPYGTNGIGWMSR